MTPTLLLTRSDVERLLTPQICIGAVEAAFRQLAEGTVPPPASLGMQAERGSFHVKAGLLTLDRAYFAAKLNANFPENGPRHGLPTIQGALILSDASNGVPLAIMDSISITALRTAAASAIAAKHLARSSWSTLLICGCGGQAWSHLEALSSVRKPQQILAFDSDPGRAAAFAGAVGEKAAIKARAVRDLRAAMGEADVAVTCTTAKKFFITRDMVRPGTFIAAVGADHETKQEIEPELLAHAKVVTDVTAQAAAIGDLHHAVAAGVMSAAQVHAELGQIVAGQKGGRVRDDEVIIFDSTGTGLQDVAAAIAVYHRALAEKAGKRVSLAEKEPA
jgi:alanine dehydrogenase